MPSIRDIILALPDDGSPFMAVIKSAFQPLNPGWDDLPPPKSSTSNSQPSKSASNSQSRSSAYAQSTPTSASKTKDHTKILSPDGKLLPEEETHCERLGLCTYCGEDHDHEKCPTKPSGSTPKEGPSSDKSFTQSKSTTNSSNSSKPKARVAQVTESVASDSDFEDTVSGYSS